MLFRLAKQTKYEISAIRQQIEPPAEESRALAPKPIETQGHKTGLIASLFSAKPTQDLFDCEEIRANTTEYIRSTPRSAL